MTAAGTRTDRRRVALLVVLVVLCGLGRYPLQAEQAARGVDVSQAEAMLGYLERAGEGEIDQDLLDRLLGAAGTDLVVAQMNLMRRVSREQYEQILRGVQRDEPPAIEPVDDTPRAARGVAGLRENVWPLLRWGMSNSALLRQRLEEIREMDFYATARRRALESLPPGSEVSAEVFVVMGGRAGAAALAGGEIYVDLLMLSFLEEIGQRPYVPESDLVDFTAHEMHHIGLGPILAARRESLTLGESGGLAYGLLSMLVSEGSATYLVNGRRDLPRALAGSEAMASLAEGAEDLLGQCGQVLEALLAGQIGSREEYERETEFLLGLGAHVAGALMLDRIDRHAGLDGVMAVLADPRGLLAAYNAAALAEAADAAGQFDPGLARAVSGLGEPGTHDPGLR